MSLHNQQRLHNCLSISDTDQKSLLSRQCNDRVCPQDRNPIPEEGGVSKAVIVIFLFSPFKIIRMKSSRLGYDYPTR